MCFIGVLLGTLVGVLPGLGPPAALALLLPVTFGVTPVSAIILLAGIYYGSQYGGSTTSILVNIPGEAGSVITCLDGYQMAKQGRPGPALGISAFGSFIAGTFSVIILMLLAPPLAEIAIKFSFPEICALILFSFTMVSYLTSGSMLKSFMMALLGMMIGTIGVDPIRGIARFNFGSPFLIGGVQIVCVVMGIFGIPEVLGNIESHIQKGTVIAGGKISGILPTLKDWKESIWPIARGTFLGFFMGVIPGMNSTITTFASYAVEKKLSKHPEKFGTGMIAGVASPEAANNATVGGALVPLLALGIPSTSAMAILMGAFMIHGVQVGPLFINEHPDVFWGVISSMYVGNVMLLILNLPLIGIWIKVLKTPYWVLAPLILLFCLVGSYSIAASSFDVLTVVLFGLVGYLMRKFRYEPVPLILGFILGPMFERNFRQSLILSYGEFLVFFKRPISAAFMILGLAVISSNLLSIKKDKLKKGGETPQFGHFSTALVLLIIAVLYFWQAINYRTGSLKSPEPGLFPAIISCILGLLALLFLVRVAIKKVSRKEQRVENPWVGLKWEKTIYVFGSLILYFFFLDVLGFLLSTFLLMEFLFTLEKKEKRMIWGTLGAFLSSGISYVIFKIVLKIQFPPGIIERILGIS